MTMPMKLFQNTIDELSSMGTYHLHITGGEPLIIGDIEERVAYAKTKIPYVHLVTNGYLLDEKMAIKLGKAKIDSISISIDGLEKTHDYYREKPGAFSHAFNALYKIKKYAPNVTVMVVTQIAPWNIQELPMLTTLLSNTGVLQRFEPTIYYQCLSERISKEDLIGANVTRIFKINTFVHDALRLDHVVNHPLFLKTIPLYYLTVNGIIHRFAFERLPLGGFANTCILPAFHVEIFEDGLMRPCFGHPYDPDFSLENRSMKEIIHSEKYKQTVKDLRYCKKCRNEFLSCYVNRQLLFPIGNFIKFMLLSYLWNLP